MHGKVRHYNIEVYLRTKLTQVSNLQFLKRENNGEYGQCDHFWQYWIMNSACVQRYLTHERTLLLKLTVSCLHVSNLLVNMRLFYNATILI